MKVKKIILAMVSTLILFVVAFGQKAYARTSPNVSEQNPIKLVSLRGANATDNYKEADHPGEYQYSIGQYGQAVPGFNAILINRIGLYENNSLRRLYDAYCARANMGFENRNEYQADENASIDTYNAKIDMVNDSDEIDQSLYHWDNYVDSDHSVKAYDAIMQLTNLFYLEGDDFDTYKEGFIKDCFIDKLDDVHEGNYDEFKNSSEFITEDLVRTVQQAVLWRFTNNENTFFTNNVNENFFVKTPDNNLAQDLAVFFENNIIKQEVNALYEYLENAAIANAKAGKAIDNDVYLYTNTNPSQIENTQPIIMIEKVNRVFDLALRKYISRVRQDKDHLDTVIAEFEESGARKPNVDSSTLNTGTTATYKHKKDPVVVEKGNVIDYKLVVYNEGQIAGRPTKIIDKLPAGVRLLSSGEVTSLIKENVYTISTNANNEVILEMKNTSNTDIDPVSSNGTLDRDCIVVRCEVTADPDENNDKIFTNIAWIAEDYNDRGIADRDSNNPTATNGGATTPTLPASLVTPDKGYTNNDNHDLTDRDHYFKGQEDDDDFEKIVLLPKKFDLALRKFIYTINDEVKNRKPVVKNATVGEETTAEKDHSKTPLQVAKGDTVVYTIRIYNEGDIAGTATEVADYLPEGLEFVTPGNGEGQSSINLENGWSNPDSTGKITTDKLAGEVIQPLNNADWTELDSLDNNDKPIYYRDLQVECKVNESAKNDNLKNVAEITEDTGDDVDSTPNENTPSPEDYGTPSTSPNGRGYEDDDDYEDLKLVELDLALRKFITRVGKVLPMTDENSTPYSRQPYDETSRKEVSPSDIVKLYNGEITTAEYKHQKNPLEVNVNDFVEYTLRVYNEGSMDGYAKEITDYLPPYLKFVECAQNTEYGWVQDASNPRIIRTSYLSSTDKKLSAVTATTLDSEEVKIICQVVDNTPAEEVQTNIAEITLYGDKDRNDLTVDRDSQTVDDEVYNGLVDIPDDKDLPNYKGHKNNKSDLTDRDFHYKGQQDDDDFEKIYVPNFDLALRKFITKVEKVNEDGTRKDRYTDTDYNARVPKVSGLEEFINNDDVTTLKYSHSKEPMDTVKNDIVTYTIRVYNEGSIPGYASVITDDIPEGVEFLPNDATNITYKWKMYAELPEGATAEAGREMVELNINEDSEIKRYVETTDVSKAKIIRTDYLSRENGARENLIKALDTKNGLSDTNPDYRDVQVAFKVTEDYGSDKIIINYAQISEDDNDWDIPDRDSTPDEWIKDEDDQDIEKIKVPQFDLALRKWVTQAIVTENGQTTIHETGHQPFDDPEEVEKVELHRKKLSDVTVKFRYSIRVYNDGYDEETHTVLPGYIAGYAKEVKDHIPEGLKFLPEDNPDWTQLDDKTIVTNKLENTLLKPGEFADVEVVLTWINGNDNLGLKINYAEISKDDNDWDVPDKDSTPDNMKERHEDDDDEAPVILSVSTGVETTYFILGLTVLITIAGGIALIKKFVM